jgi:deoxyguanosine kinase
MFHYNYIAIEGCIGAGKTTLATKLSQSGKARLFLEKFEDNPFLPLFYNDPERHAFPVELYFMAERFQQLKHVSAENNLFNMQTVSDFIFQKSLIFAGNNLSVQEKQLYRMLFDIMLPTLPKPDVIVYLFSSVERLLANIKMRGRMYEQSIQPEYLENIQEAYLSYFKQMTDARIVLLDTDKYDFVGNEMHYAFLQELLSGEIQIGISRY